jgi:uncharacterized membrane protein
MKLAHKGGRPFYYLAAVTAASVALIALNAALGMQIPFAVEFLVAYVGLLMVFVVSHAYLTKGWRRSLAMLAASFVVAFTAEALGINFGLIFGRYYYTKALGVQLFGVPLLAALAWEPIVYAAFATTDLLVSPLGRPPGQAPVRRRALLGLSLIGALATTAWDMMIDPIAVHEGWWVWENGGPYVPHVENGVPISNFLGWLGVAFVINLLYRFLAGPPPARQRSPTLNIYGPLMLYASLFLTAAGVTLTVLRRADVALVGLLAMGPFLAIALTSLSLQESTRAGARAEQPWPSVDDGRPPVQPDHHIP